MWFASAVPFPAILTRSALRCALAGFTSRRTAVLSLSTNHYCCMRYNFMLLLVSFSSHWYNTLTTTSSRWSFGYSQRGDTSTSAASPAQPIRVHVVSITSFKTFTKLPSTADRKTTIFLIAMANPCLVPVHTNSNITNYLSIIENFVQTKLDTVVYIGNVNKCLIYKQTPADYFPCVSSAFSDAVYITLRRVELSCNYYSGSFAGADT